MGDQLRWCSYAIAPAPTYSQNQPAAATNSFYRLTVGLGGSDRPLGASVANRFGDKPIAVLVAIALISLV